MTESDTPQQSLAAFESNDSTTTSASASASTDSQRESVGSPSGSEAVATDPLTELYEIVSEAAKERLPDAAQDLSISTSIDPDTRHHTTAGLPDGVPALPFEIGHWELAVSNPDRIIYTTSGDAYDYRWGNGGALYGMEVYLNDRGANRDGKYHRRASTVIGFENGDQVRRATVNSKSDLITVRGHNVGKNDGDRGYSTGTQARYGTPKEAVIELLLYLHRCPGPVGQYTTSKHTSEWAQQKLSPRKAKWTAAGPDHIDDETLQLVLSDNTLSIKSTSDGQPATEMSYYDLPELGSVSESVVMDGGARNKFEAPAAAITAANDLLRLSPTEAVVGGQID